MEVEPRVAKRYSSDRAAAIKRTKERSSSTGGEGADRARDADLSFSSAAAPQVFHELSTRFPQSRLGGLAGGLGTAIVALLLGATAAVGAASDGTATASAATTYRLFLRDQ